MICMNSKKFYEKIMQVQIIDKYMNFYEKNILALPQYRTKLVSDYMQHECIDELPWKIECINDTSIICHTSNSYANLIRKNEKDIRIVYEEISESLIRTYPAKNAYNAFKFLCKKNIDKNICDLKFSDIELDKTRNFKILDFNDKKYLNDTKIENILNFIFLIENDENILNKFLKKLNDKLFTLGYNFAEKRCYKLQVQPLSDKNLILVQIIFEAEFYEQKFEFQKYLYHVTFINKLKKIKKYGLILYSKSHKFDYPDRVYLFNTSNINIILNYAREKCEAIKQKQVFILKISSEKLQKSSLYKNGKMTFFVDSMFKFKKSDTNAIFTYNNIPNYLISEDILKISFSDNFREKKLEICKI